MSLLATLSVIWKQWHFVNVLVVLVGHQARFVSWVQVAHHTDDGFYLLSIAGVRIYLILDRVEPPLWGQAAGVSSQETQIMAIHIRLTRKATGPWLYVILHVKDMTGRFAPNTPPGHILMLFYSRRLKVGVGDFSAFPLTSPLTWLKACCNNWVGLAHLRYPCHNGVLAQCSIPGGNVRMQEVWIIQEGANYLCFSNCKRVSSSLRFVTYFCCFLWIYRQPNVVNLRILSTSYW